jgi:hypothetical protein
MIMMRIRGFVIFFVGLGVLAFLMNGAANWLEMQPTPADKKFEVVDTYKGCDVVEYSPTNAARYQYFLHCPK